MENEDISLSDYALKALQEFYQEKVAHVTAKDNTNYLIEENWELSQFWYDENTAIMLAKVALTAAKTGSIACISCPTVYNYLCSESNTTKDIYLFEYDKRFQDLYQDHFIYYNYNEPLKIPENFKSYFEVVLVDPPYLSEECLEKVFETVKYVAKDKIILCTGAVMEDFAEKVMSLKPCDFKPQHARKLGNEFKCYANWNLDELMKEIQITSNINS